METSPFGEGIEEVIQSDSALGPLMRRLFGMETFCDARSRVTVPMIQKIHTFNRFNEPRNLRSKKARESKSQPQNFERTLISHKKLDHSKEIDS